ncbi:hypothetical protein CAter282_2976 [Collimonas arenae]|uniref:Uncharacterized protein n=1 Tax=Collimonas arenae TaxID=279058 RepID=A0A127PST6_9BURK|nr:hypothetical protein CAter10_3273 [Collimonas arenae]AMP10697.1 hypothetical protein CAter282_2976 [Collimonas arenae]
MLTATENGDPAEHQLPNCQAGLDVEKKPIDARMGRRRT